jgi:hypothetical protein
LVVRQGGGIGGVEEICHSLIFHTDETATMTIESDNDIGVVREVLKEFGLEFHELANEGRGRVKDFVPHVVSVSKGHSGAGDDINSTGSDVVDGARVASYGIDRHFILHCSLLFLYCLNIG